MATTYNEVYTSERDPDSTGTYITDQGERTYIKGGISPWPMTAEGIPEWWLEEVEE